MEKLRSCHPDQKLWKKPKKPNSCGTPPLEPRSEKDTNGKTSEIQVKSKVSLLVMYCIGFLVLKNRP